MEKMTHKQVQQQLADEMVEVLRGSHDTPLHWNESKLHLMEVVRYVFISEKMRDDTGVPLSQREIASRVFRLFDMYLPHNICSYLSRLDNIKGVRSQRLVDIMVYRANEQKERMSLFSFIR